VGAVPHHTVHLTCDMISYADDDDGEDEYVQLRLLDSLLTVWLLFLHGVEAISPCSSHVRHA
jgi:hypothetical protein